MLQRCACGWALIPDWLGTVFEGIEASISASTSDLDIRQVACDSRKVQPRAVFFALRGAKDDGNAFIRDAVARGAVAIASEEAAPLVLPASGAWIRVRDGRKPVTVAVPPFFWPPAQAVAPVARPRPNLT